MHVSLEKGKETVRRSRANHNVSLKFEFQFYNRAFTCVGDVDVDAVDVVGGMDIMLIL